MPIKYPECECLYCYADEVESLEELFVKISPAALAAMPDETRKQIQDVIERPSPERNFY